MNLFKHKKSSLHSDSSFLSQHFCTADEKSLHISIRKRCDPPTLLKHVILDQFLHRSETQYLCQHSHSENLFNSCKDVKIFFSRSVMIRLLVVYGLNLWFNQFHTSGNLEKCTLHCHHGFIWHLLPNWTVANQDIKIIGVLEDDQGKLLFLVAVVCRNPVLIIVETEAPRA